MTKANGYEQQNQGLQLYVLEWQGELVAAREFWKGGDAIVGYWQNFTAAPERPQGFGASLWKRFGKGAMIRLTGDATMLKTDRGWRVEGLKVKTSQFVNPGVDFVGTWNGFYRPDAGTPFEATHSSGYVIVEKGSSYSVTTKTVADGRSFSQTFLYRDGKLILAGADGQPEPPDPLTGTTPEIALVSDGSLRIIEEGEFGFGDASESSLTSKWS